MSNLILIGFMGAGKSAVGRRVAERAGARYIDTDKEIEREQGVTIAQLFSERGETAFREIETNLIARLLDGEAADPAPRRSMRLVLSTGGGLPLREENKQILKNLGHVLWLRAKPDTIIERIGHKIALRPLIANHGGNLMERIVELQSERYPKYDLIADCVIDTDHCLNPDQAATLVFDHWKRQLATPRHHDNTHKTEDKSHTAN